MKFFDSHAHYFDAWFNEYEGGADALLDKIFAQQVGAIVNIATNPENLSECIAQAKKYENMYVSSGIHPEDCLYIDDIDAALSEIEASICNEKLRKENKIVAIGEIGFDYHLENLTDEVKAKQRHVFEAQMQMAEKYGLPVIIHDREAHGDCFEMALKYPSVKGIFHSYSGSSEMARELIRRGWYISFSGVVTFKNASRVREVVSTIPLDRLLIETDAPYLSPHPLRGKMNHSANLEYTAGAIAAVFGKTPEEIAEITFENAQRIYGL
jgi:TatD DNase family protein